MVACTDWHGSTVCDNVNNIYTAGHAVYVHIAVYIYTVCCMLRSYALHVVFNDDVYNLMALWLLLYY